MTPYEEYKIYNDHQDNLFDSWFKNLIKDKDSIRVFDTNCVNLSQTHLLKKGVIKGYEKSLTDLKLHPTNKRWRRAISLDGLEDNNGWIKFNSEVEIEPTTNYWVRTSNDVIQLLHGSIINSIKTKNLIQITHIIPIIEPKPPLYNEE